jgi:hypothetical protein
MSKLKLVYFDTKGIAETSRLILKISGINFEDIRYAIDFDKQNKPCFPELEDKEFQKLLESILPSLDAEDSIFMDEIEVF